MVLETSLTKRNIANMLDNMFILVWVLSRDQESLIIKFDCSTYLAATSRKLASLTLKLKTGLEDVTDMLKNLAEGLLRLNGSVQVEQRC